VRVRDDALMQGAVKRRHSRTTVRAILEIGYNGYRQYAFRGGSGPSTSTVIS
jgi:hypothetical protein